MTPFRTGNVIKSPYGTICIVTNCTDDYVSWVSFSSENSSGGGSLEDTTRNETCYCNENYDYGNNYDPECSDCKGSGGYEVKVLGYKRSELLASCVKDYILKRLTKNFDF